MSFAVRAWRLWFERSITGNSHQVRPVRPPESSNVDPLSTFGSVAVAGDAYRDWRYFRRGAPAPTLARLLRYFALYASQSHVARKAWAAARPL